MPDIRINAACEKKHAPLARIAAGALELLPTSGTLFIADADCPPDARRSGDRTVSLGAGPQAKIERIGRGSTAITYENTHSLAARAAIIAAGALPGTPVCADPGSLALLALAQRVAASNIPVLIDGPTGTGKEVLARFIHENSARKDGPFVAINCAAMPEAMLEAMLFGHLKGAFTGAAQASEGFFRAADGGTLLLDEIAEMPIGLQAKLLRALQEGEVVPIGATMPIPVDVRIVACANRDLPTEVAEGRLRPDLYYRLNVFPLSLAALRTRPGDIAPLAFTMALRHGPQSGMVPWISDAALDKLNAHTWPGNIRELENVIRRALLLCGDATQIEPQDIVFDAPARVLPRHDAAPAAPYQRSADTGSAKLSSVVRHSEADAIFATLAECGGHRLHAAKRLGISERTLRYRLASLRDAGMMKQPAYAGAAQ